MESAIANARTKTISMSTRCRCAGVLGNGIVMKRFCAARTCQLGAFSNHLQMTIVVRQVEESAYRARENTMGQKINPLRCVSASTGPGFPRFAARPNKSKLPDTRTSGREILQRT